MRAKNKFGKFTPPPSSPSCGASEFEKLSRARIARSYSILRDRSVITETHGRLPSRRRPDSRCASFLGHVSICGIDITTGLYRMGACKVSEERPLERGMRVQLADRQLSREQCLSISRPRRICIKPVRRGAPNEILKLYF